MSYEVRNQESVWKAIDEVERLNEAAGALLKKGDKGILCAVVCLAVSWLLRSMSWQFKPASYVASLFGFVFAVYCFVYIARHIPVMRKAKKKLDEIRRGIEAEEQELKERMKKFEGGRVS